MHGLIDAPSGIIENVLGKFSCTKDSDIENFIKNKAVEFESLYKSRTYLLCDESALVNNKLLEFYTSNGFRIFKRDIDNESMVQMIKAF